MWKGKIFKKRTRYVLRALTIDRKGSNRPERKSALVMRELQRYNVVIAALSETRFLDVGELSEVGSGYTLFWSGRKAGRKAGVGFAVKTSLVSQLESQPIGINERIMTMRLPLSDNNYATMVSVYAPTMTNPEEAKDTFYQQLDDIIGSVPQNSDTTQHQIKSLLYKLRGGISKHFFYEIVLLVLQNLWR